MLEKLSIKYSTKKTISLFEVYQVCLLPAYYIITGHAQKYATTLRSSIT